MTNELVRGLLGCCRKFRSHQNRMVDRTFSDRVKAVAGRGRKSACACLQSKRPPPATLAISDPCGRTRTSRLTSTGAMVLSGRPHCGYARQNPDVCGSSMSASLLQPYQVMPPLACNDLASLTDSITRWGVPRSRSSYPASKAKYPRWLPARPHLCGPGHHQVAAYCANGTTASKKMRAHARALQPMPAGISIPPRSETSSKRNSGTRRRSATDKLQRT